LLAWDQIGRVDAGSSDEWRDLDSAKAGEIRAAARSNLARFPGPETEIDGRPYLDLSDYSRWRGRAVRGPLKSTAQRGLVAESWNVWVETHGSNGTAALGRVPVTTLDSYLDPAMLTVHEPAEAEARQQSRRELLAALRPWDELGAGTEHTSASRFASKATAWRERAAASLAELHVLSVATERIEQQYSCGHAVLMAGVAGELTERTGDLEEAVEAFNLWLAGPLDQRAECLRELGLEGSLGKPMQPLVLDAKAVECAAAEEARATVTYLVDLAKAEALGYVGEREAAMEIVARQLDTMTR